jgi:hypothetical protein
VLSGCEGVVVDFVGFCRAVMLLVALVATLILSVALLGILELVTLCGCSWQCNGLFGFNALHVMGS